MKDNSIDQSQVVIDCNTLLNDVDDVIMKLFGQIKTLYRLRFPELETIVKSPISYIRLVRTIGNDLSSLSIKDRQSKLSTALSTNDHSVILLVTMTAEHSIGSALPPSDLALLFSRCKEAEFLIEMRHNIMDFMETNIQHLAPNVVSLLNSSRVASRLISAAGNLKVLCLQAGNIKLMGSGANAGTGLTLRDATGDGSLRVAPGRGIVWECDIVQQTEPAFQAKAANMIASKISLAARSDLTNSDPLGQYGISLRNQLLERIEKQTVPSAGPVKKPLPIPDAEHLKRKSRRGGERQRKAKEKWGQTEARTMMNRLAFGTEMEEMAGLNDEEGLGMLTSGGGGEKSLDKLFANSKNNNGRLNSASKAVMAKLRKGSDLGLEHLVRNKEGELMEDMNGVITITSGVNKKRKENVSSNTGFFTFNDF